MLAAQLQQVLELLVACSRSEEECRNVVAECFGRLALLHPAEVLARLRAGMASDNEHTRCVVVGAVKHMVVDRPHPVDDLLKVGGAQEQGGQPVCMCSVSVEGFVWCGKRFTSGVLLCKSARFAGRCSVLAILGQNVKTCGAAWQRNHTG